MGSIFGKAVKGFGMLKKSKDSSKLLKRRKELGGIDWETFKKQHKAPPGVPGTDKAKQKIASDFVKIRKRTKPAWKKNKIKPMEKAKGGAVKKLTPGGYGPTNPPSDRPKSPWGARASKKSGPHDRHPPKKTTNPWEKARPRAGRPGARAPKKSGPHDRHPPKRRGMGPAAGRPPKKRPRPMSTS
jgi:hypothetical protein